LHGLIVAEAYGIDALMLTVGKPLHGDLFKFDDYFASTGRPTFYADFIEVSDIKSLVAMAMNNPKPNINIHPLLDAFPFECARERVKHPSDTAWSRIHGTATIYRSSIRPPCLLIPEED